MDYLLLFQNLGSFLIGSGVIGFVAKSLFEHSMDKGLATYKLQLDKQAEAYKHELQLITQQHKIQYSKLHVDRAEVINQLYQKLVAMESAMQSYMSPINLSPQLTREERQKVAGVAAQEFFGYFHKSEIFFDPSICQLIDEMSKQYALAWSEFTSYDDQASRDAAASDAEFRKERIKVFKSAFAILSEKIPPIKQKLEYEFRVLLGVLTQA
jgi:hypothetical protein